MSAQHKLCRGILVMSVVLGLLGAALLVGLQMTTHILTPQSMTVLVIGGFLMVIGFVLAAFSLEPPNCTEK